MNNTDTLLNISNTSYKAMSAFGNLMCAGVIALPVAIVCGAVAGYDSTPAKLMAGVSAVGMTVGFFGLMASTASFMITGALADKKNRDRILTNQSGSNDNFDTPKAT